MNLNRNDFKSFCEKLKEFDNIILAIHVDPDGDTVGSALAVYKFLKSLKKNVFVYSQGGVPESCKFLPDAESIISNELPENLGNYDLFLFIDCNGFKRVGLSDKIRENFKAAAIIDHHIKTENRVDFTLIDETSSSTAQIIYDMLESCGARIDEYMAKYLLCGIICDTGAFKFSNTDAHTFYTAGKLVEAGADAAKTVKEYFDSKPINALKLAGYVLNNLMLYDNGKIVIGFVPKSVLDDLKATREDTEGINALINSLKGFEFSAFIREVEKNVFRCSFRGKGQVDCNKIAMFFDGGGHINASGATIEGDYDDVLERILKEVRKWTDSL